MAGAYRRNSFFTGRETVLARLAVLLGAGKTAALSQAQALSGLGSIGKTQTAVEYAGSLAADSGYVEDLALVEEAVPAGTAGHLLLTTRTTVPAAWPGSGTGGNDARRGRAVPELAFSLVVPTTELIAHALFLRQPMLAGPWMSWGHESIENLYEK